MSLSSHSVIRFGELFNLYRERHIKLHAKNQKAPQYFLNVYGDRWNNIPVSEITRTDVQNWVDETGESRGIHAANLAVNTMSAAFEWSKRRGFVTCVNPCVGVERFRTQSRKRFLSPEELNRFTRSLDKEPPSVRDFFYMLLFSGARRGNVMAMRWDEVDLDLALWTIPETKNGDSHIIPLTVHAVELLRRRRATMDSIYVFPSLSRRPRSGSPHIKNVSNAFRRIVRRAEISNLRIHDLRRTVASYMAINGESPFVIGAVLGHKDQRSTAVYARLNVSPLKTAIEKAAGRMFGLDSSEDRSSVVAPSASSSAFIPQPVSVDVQRTKPGSEKLHRAEQAILHVLDRATGASRTDFHRSLSPSNRVSAKDIEWLLHGLTSRGLIAVDLGDDNVQRFALTEFGRSVLRLRERNSRLVDTLSKRQKEIVLLVIQRKTNAEIAEMLGLSLHTVKNYMRDILAKMKARSKEEAAQTALRELAA